MIKYKIENFSEYIVNIMEVIRTKDEYKFEKIEKQGTGGKKVIHNNRKNQKKQSGITLVALVVTIVILIILATITINVVFDDGGLIDIVKGAKNDAEDLVQSEDKKMNDLLQEYANIMEGEVEIPEPEPEVDTTPPIVTVTAGGKTTNSITVNVQATDSESGMKENPTYTYYIKKSSEADSSYQAKATDVTNSSYTFAGLQQETSYDIKVEVNGDKAGNKGTGTLTGQTTKKVPGGETGVEEGAITFGTTTWSGGKANITISTNTGMQIQYQVDSTSGSWTKISNGGTVGNLQHGQTVYARLTDGTNYGDYASASIVDGIKPNAPTITLSGTVGTNSWYKSNVTVKITAGSDGQSGANKIRYKVTGAQTISQTDTAAGTTSASITISTNGTSTITAYTIDKAGNVSSAKTQQVKKDTIAPTVSSITTGTITENSIQVTVSASDGQSGLATSNTYKFYQNGTLVKTQTSNSYTFTGLTAGTQYTIKVEAYDKAGNKGEKTVTATTKTAGLGAGEVNKNPSTYYGAEVIGYTCSSQGVNKWRIFYADSTNIYLIADDYISYQYAPNGKNGSAIYKNNTDWKLSFDNVYIDYTGAGWINSNSKGKKWLNQFLGSYSSSTNKNAKAVAYMMDTNVWSTYAGTNAEYAMGGPTLEMYCASYKQTHSSKYVECQANSTGYQVKWNTDSSWSYAISGLPQDDFNKIYINSDSSKANAMWLASPSAYDTNHVMYANCNGNVYASAYSSGNPGLRPLVCLKSSVQLKKVSTGVYEIVK